MERVIVITLLPLLLLLAVGCANNQQATSSSGNNSQNQDVTIENSVQGASSESTATVNGGEKTPNQTDVQVAQQAGNYVSNYYSNQNITVTDIDVKYENNYNTAIASVNYKDSSGSPKVVYVVLPKGGNGGYTPDHLGSKSDYDNASSGNPATTKQQNSNTKQSSNPTTTAKAGSSQASSCTPKSGNVIYQADWSKGMDGWTGSSDWKHTDSMLVSDGSPGHPTQEERILAPCQPPTQNYALEAKIQLVNPQCGATYKEFGVVARETEQGGIIGGIDCDQAKLAIIQNGGVFDLGLKAIGTASAAPGTDWHVYRLEVEGNQIRFLVDGTSVLQKTDNSILSGSNVGMFSVGAQINVQSFRILTL